MSLLHLSLSAFPHSSDNVGAVEGGVTKSLQADSMVLHWNFGRYLGLTKCLEFTFKIHISRSHYEELHSWYGM